MITTEALPRIPVNRFNTDGSDYVVPDGYRLVIEPCRLYVVCDSGMPLSDLTLRIYRESGHIARPGRSSLSRLGRPVFFF